MSANTVRTLARQWASGGSITYYETVNTHNHPHDDLWVTLEFNAEYVEDLTTMGCGRMEYGTLDLTFLTTPGKCDDALPAIETFVDDFMKNTDPNQKFALLGRDILETFDAEGEQYRIVQGINYVFSH